MADLVHQPGKALAEPGQRGHLSIANRAVQRIAAAAAGRVPGVAPRRAGVTAALTRSYPRADVVVAGTRVRARIEVAGKWPVAAPTLAAQVQITVMDELQRLAGLTVDAVDVTIAAMIHDQTPVRRVR